MQQGDQSICKASMMVRPNLFLGVKATIHIVWVPSSPGAKFCQLWVCLNLNAPALQYHCSLIPHNSAMPAQCQKVMQGHT